MNYVCFMKHDVRHLYFFDWFYNTITYPTVVAIRKRYNKFYDTKGDEVTQRKHHNDKCILWGDSDIPYLQHKTNPARVGDSMDT